MHRFFVGQDQIFNDIIEIYGKDVKHIKDVLRIKEGEEIEVSSHGITYICQIISFEKNKVNTQILEKTVGQNEAPIDIVLYQGLAKGSKMDLIFQKCTELGVKKFYPLATRRSVVKIKDIKKEETKVERWNAIVDEAAKQSKRDMLPMVESILTLDDMIEQLKDEDNIIVAYENEERLTIKDIKDDLTGEKIHIIIGPEGGFDPEEIEGLKSIGAKIVSLGPRILRTETAGIVASTIFLYELGDLGVI